MVLSKNSSTFTAEIRNKLSNQQKKPMIRKTILALILLLTAASAAMAGSKYLYVTDIDGTTAAIKIENNLICEVYESVNGDKVTYHVLIREHNGTPIEINGALRPDVPEELVTFDMPFRRLKSLSMEAPAGVGSVDTMSFQVDITNSTVTMTGLAEQINVSVCSADGVVLMSESVTDSTSIDLSQLGHGLMIVTAGTKTFKIFVP